MPELKLSANRSAGPHSWDAYPLATSLRLALRTPKRSRHSSKAGHRTSVGCCFASSSVRYVDDVATNAAPLRDEETQEAFDCTQFNNLGVPAAVQLAVDALASSSLDTDDSGTSYACQLPLTEFFGRALEVSREGQLTTPITSLRIVVALSHLKFGTSSAAAPFQELYQRAATAMMESADGAGSYQLDFPDLLSGEDVLSYFEAVAAMDFPATVYKGSGFGLLLAHHLRHGGFSHEQQLRLLEAWASLRQQEGGYNPCVQNFSRLGQLLASGASSFTDEELLRVVLACRAFEWPAFSSMNLLEDMCATTISRVAANEMPLAIGQRIVRYALDSAANGRPGPAQVLKEKLSARLADNPEWVSVVLSPSQHGPAEELTEAKNNAGRMPTIGDARTLPMGVRRNNAVVGPSRRKLANLIKGLTACLPAAVLLAFSTLPQWPPVAVVSALLVVSLVVVSEV